MSCRNVEESGKTLTLRHLAINQYFDYLSVGISPKRVENALPLRREMTKSRRRGKRIKLFENQVIGIRLT